MEPRRADTERTISPRRRTGQLGASEPRSLGHQFGIADHSILPTEYQLSPFASTMANQHHQPNVVLALTTHAHAPPLRPAPQLKYDLRTVPYNGADEFPTRLLRFQIHLP
ncbi:hypothetical protein E2P81_ATG01827 [Venturia nashicola]|nr:hypothetical protein E2P81_ATG01827 [Venturia nashicola]